MKKTFLLMASVGLMTDKPMDIQEALLRIHNDKAGYCIGIKEISENGDVSYSFLKDNMAIRSKVSKNVYNLSIMKSQPRTKAYIVDYSGNIVSEVPKKSNFFSRKEFDKRMTEATWNIVQEQELQRQEQEAAIVEEFLNS